MPKFQVFIYQTTRYELQVEAETSWEAEVEAMDLFRNGQGDEVLLDPHEVLVIEREG